MTARSAHFSVTALSLMLLSSCSASSQSESEQSEQSMVSRAPSASELGSNSCARIPESGEVTLDVVGTPAKPQNGDALQQLLDCQTLPARAGKKLLITLQSSQAGTYLDIDKPLQVHSNTYLRGGTAPSGQAFGAILHGRNSTDRNAQLAYRGTVPIVSVLGTSANPVGNVTIYNLEFTGNLTYSSVEIVNADQLPGVAPFADAAGFSVNIVSNRITGSRGNGINAWTSRKINIQYLSLIAVRRAATDPVSTEGGASIWFYQTSDSSIQNNVLMAPDFWAAGPNANTGNPRVCMPGWQPAGCLDPGGLAQGIVQIGIYGGHSNFIAHNWLAYSNAAVLYIARICTASGDSYQCPLDHLIRATDMVVWDNDIQYARELGVDLDTADRVQVLANRIGDTDVSGIGIAQTNDGVFKYNVLARTGLFDLYGYAGAGVGPIGALRFNWGSSGNVLAGNVISGTSADYAVFFGDVATRGTSNNRVDFDGGLQAGRYGNWSTNLGCGNAGGNQVSVGGVAVACSP